MERIKDINKLKNWKNKDKKITFANVITSLYYIFIILGCAGAVYFSLKAIVKLDLNKTIIFSLAYIVFWLIFYLFLKRINLNKRYKEVILVCAVIILGMFLRIMANVILKTLPVSDFNTPNIVYQLADTGIFDKRDSLMELSSYQVYYTLFPAWFPFMKVVSLIYDIFSFNIIYIKAMNWILYICSSLLIYNIGKKIFSKKVGIVALLLYAIYPSLVVYTNITTPDHISAFLFLVLIWTWIKIIECRGKSLKKLIGYSIFNIIIFCMINLFKPLSVFGLCLFIGTEILGYFIYNIQDKENRKANIKFGLIYTGLFLICGFGAIQLTNKVLYNVVEKKINNEVVDSTPLYMLWAYSIDAKGVYNSNLVNPIWDETVLRNNNDLKLALEEISDVSKKQFINNLPYLKSILYQKFKILFINENDCFLWALHSNDKEYDALMQKKYLDDFTIVMLVFCYILYGMILVSLIKEVKNKEKNKEVIVVSLLVIGYFAVLILGGIQPRYKSLVYGPLCILAANFLPFKKEDE